MRNVALLAIE